MRYSAVVAISWARARLLIMWRPFGNSPVILLRVFVMAARVIVLGLWREAFLTDCKQRLRIGTWRLTMLKRGYLILAVEASDFWAIPRAIRYAVAQMRPENVLGCSPRLS